MIDCKHWSSCSRSIGGGCCSIGLYGGKPSLGICKNTCTQRVELTISASPSVESSPHINKSATPSFPKKAVSYLKAEMSAIFSSISDADVQARRDACTSCPRLKKSEIDGQIGWCTACGCGTGPRAEITVKSKMPAATCPLDKWPKREE